MHVTDVPRVPAVAAAEWLRRTLQNEHAATGVAGGYGGIERGIPTADHQNVGLG